MKRSEEYYLKRIEKCVDKIMQGKTIKFDDISCDTLLGMKNVSIVYLEKLWMTIGDTAFNKMNYRVATDYLFEQLDSHT